VAAQAIAGLTSMVIAICVPRPVPVSFDDIHRSCWYGVAIFLGNYFKVLVICHCEEPGLWPATKQSY
jgi:hypothetical protein